MKSPKIKVISASAGSGKTYRLTEELAQRLAGKGAAPEEVIAVTFTKSAAEELKGRVRSRLFEKGMPEEAQRMEGALVGTVHAVCEALLKRFAFEAGLSPRIEVLPEDQAEAFFERAVAQALTPDVLADLTPALERFQMREPLQPVKKLAELARLNRIPASALPAMAEDSIRRYHKAVLKDPPAWPSAKAADDALRKAIDKAVPAMQALIDGDTPDNSAKCPSDLQGVRSKLENGTLTWSARASICKDPGRLLKALAAPLQDLAAKSVGHPLLREDVECITRHLFDLAGKALLHYEEWKRARALIDFTDMEALALDLLGRDEVRAALQGDFKLLLVDEFQDTSPLQLALFSRLGEIVEEVVWVGDKKQAIFGFRDSDPVLMDAAYAEASKAAKPDLLTTSYRSRPELVEFCNRLFVPVFKAIGASPEEVELAAHRKAEPKRGPALECWVLESPNQPTDDLCLVQGIQALLDSDDPTRITDPVTGDLRPVRPGDIAVLRRKNKGCKSLAAALNGAGIQAALAQTGLNDTLEATYLLAAVETVLDRRAALPALTLLLFQHPADPEALLNERLRLVRKYKEDKEWEDPWTADTILKRLRDLSEDLRVLSPSQMLDRVIEASGLEELCLRWGSGELRLGNVDRLRACARQYEAECALTGSGASLLGLHAWIDALDEGGEQAAWASEYAVQISTYHKAKGREWPVVVLGDLHNAGKARVLSASPAVESRAKAFDLGDPLKDRSLRYWPWPYKGSSTGAPLWNAINATAEEQEAAQRTREEEMRLFYVGFTRARDLLVLPGRDKQSTPKALEKLGITFNFPVHASTGKAAVDFGGGLKAKCVIRNLNGQGVATGVKPGPIHWFARPAGDAPKRDPLFLNASEIPAFSVPASQRPSVPAIIPLGSRLAFSGGFTKDEPAFGDAIHAFLAADRPEMSKSDRTALAKRLIDAHDAAKFLSPEAFVEAADRLYAWINKTHPGASIHRELPVQHRIGDQIISGTVDMVLEKADGFVIIDHKGFPGDEKQCQAKALTFSSQLDAYARALEKALDKPCRSRLIHFPVQGLIVELK